jgi:hypothetical protein
MKRVHAMVLASALAATLGATLVAAGDHGDSRERALRARLQAENEVPAVISAASGLFTARVADGDESISYELSYTGLEGNVTQAHIHVGQKTASGGIMIWLCSNQPSPPTPAGVQPCPAAPATITGTIAPADVVGPASQGVSAGNWADALAAIRGGLAYVNVHSSVSPGGEVRGQIR